jgi:hypothetical protein
MPQPSLQGCIHGVSLSVPDDDASWKVQIFIGPRVLPGPNPICIIRAPFLPLVIRQGKRAAGTLRAVSDGSGAAGRKT